MEHRRKNPNRQAGASLGSDNQPYSAKRTESPFAHRKTYLLPKGRQVSFCLDFANSQIVCEWRPGVPNGKLLRKIWADYLAVRHDFLSGLGVSVAVIDL